MFFDEVVAGGEQTEVRILFSNITFQTQHCNVSVLPEKARVHWIGLLFGGEISRRVVAGDEKPECIAPALAGKFRGPVGIYDRPRVHCAHWSLKNVNAFEKERTLFLKEDRETLIRGNYRLIGFDLREIGI